LELALRLDQLVLHWLLLAVLAQLGLGAQLQAQQV